MTSHFVLRGGIRDRLILSACYQLNLNMHRYSVCDYRRENFDKFPYSKKTTTWKPYLLETHVIMEVVQVSQQAFKILIYHHLH